MASGYAPLPAYQVPRNAMLDFSGLNEGLDTYRQGIEQAYKGETNRMIGGAMAKGDYKGAAAQAFSRGELDAGMKVNQYAQGQDDRLKQKFGNAAMLVMQEKDPAARAQKWQRVLALHPDAKSLDASYHNPETGPLALLGDANMAQDWLKYELQRRGADIQAAAAGRDAQLFPGKLEAQQLDLQKARRDLDAPKGSIEKVGADERLYHVDPRTRQATELVSGQGNHGPYKSAKDRVGVEGDLRKEFAGHAKEFTTVQNAYNQIDQIAKQPSAASDVALIYSFMKILDPGSVVRETEYATAQNAAGVPDQVRNVFNRVLAGERLNPTQREDFVKQARTVYGVRERGYKDMEGQYRGIAQRSGVDPSNVLLNFIPPAAPQPGTSGPPAPPFNPPRSQAPGVPTGPSAVPRISSDADYDALPSGARFVYPEGRTRVKP